MEGVGELRQNWEFAATWKLLDLLSKPLSFSVPTPTQLEDALLNPNEHLSVISNVHGRLLGLAVGVSAAKKWLLTTSRFVRQRPHEFSFILSQDSKDVVIKKEPVSVEGKEEPSPTVEYKTETDHGRNTDSVESKPFPRQEEDYFSLRPITRLLVLHTIAEIVLSEHDSLLCAGNIGDIPIEEMRLGRMAGDAVGNNYWYFGDSERVYREPGRKKFKTRLQQAEEEAAAAEKSAAAAEKSAAEAAARVEREEKRKEVERVREETRLKREEKRRKKMEKWAPRVAASRTTRASRRAERSLLTKAAKDSLNMSNAGEPRENDANLDSSGSRKELFGGQGTDGAQPLPSQDLLTGSDSTENMASGRRCKSSPIDEVVTASSSARKRPRKSDKFEDPALRECDGWEMMSSGASSLRDILERFKTGTEAVLPSEKVLIRRLEEEILPQIKEQEEKLRREQERIERKKRAAEILFTCTKRSSRVQALEQRREEAARKAAAEEERENDLEERRVAHTEAVKAQIANLENEQAKEIRSIRHEHGRTEAIDRDDQFQRARERKSASEERAEAAATRRSVRSRRGSRRASDLEGNENISREGSVNPRRSRRHIVEHPGDTPSNTESDVKDVNENRTVRVEEQDETPMVVVEEPVDVDGNKPVDLEDQGKEPMDVVEEQDGTALVKPLVESGSAAPEGQVNEINGLDDAKKSEDLSQSETECIPSEVADKDRLSSGKAESLIGDSYTWLTNPDDGEPIRVLDKFFFAVKPSFEDAPLEMIDNEGSQVVGFGILLPPFGSNVEATRVEIGEVKDWVIEYGEEPKLWTKSADAWYELRDPALEYRSAFSSTKRKFELCVRIHILGTTSRAAELGYNSIVELLGFRYNDMQSFTEAQVVEEKRFIMSQMEALERKSILQSGFIRELRKKIRTEDAKTWKAEMATAEKAQAKTEPQENNKKASTSKGSNAVASNETKPKKRSSASGKPVVPRVVSSIISGLLRAATKSSVPSRKRKTSASSRQNQSGGVPQSPAKKIKQISKWNDKDANRVHVLRQGAPSWVRDGNEANWVHVAREGASSRVKNAFEKCNAADHNEVPISQASAGHSNETQLNRTPVHPSPPDGTVVPCSAMKLIPSLTPVPLPDSPQLSNGEVRKNDSEGGPDGTSNEAREFDSTPAEVVKRANSEVRQTCVTSPHGMQNGRINLNPNPLPMANGYITQLRDLAD